MKKDITKLNYEETVKQYEWYSTSRPLTVHQLHTIFNISLGCMKENWLSFCKQDLNHDNRIYILDEPTPCYELDQLVLACEATYNMLIRMSQLRYWMYVLNGETPPFSLIPYYNDEPVREWIKLSKSLETHSLEPDK